MKKLPIGIQTFSDLIEGDYIYVDKTEAIYNLFAGGGRYYFLSRPRRFGKSLLLSTIKEIFSGSKELFKGLWIYDKIDWEKHPIIHIDFSKIGYNNPEVLEKELDIKIEELAAEQGITLYKGKTPVSKFGELIEKVSEKNRSKVVLLIDEYDKPIIDFIAEKKIAAANRDILRQFYTVIKASDQYLEFAFLTGVSKFSRVSVFSGLNNLNDITHDEKYSTMLGYTHEELLFYFDTRLAQALKKRADQSKEKLVAEIKRWYNGYTWDARHFVYNPFSILNFFDKNRFSNYWFTSATPTFLIKLVRQRSVNVEKLEHYRAGESFFNAFEVDNINVASLLFQTGYLTIEKIEESEELDRIYTLSYPNLEVEKSFLEHLLAEFSSQYPDEIGVLVYDLKKYLYDNELDTFFELIKSLFASIPYNIFPADKESYYHSLIYLLLTLVGVNVQCEIQTHKGRIDAVIEAPEYIFIMEFKMDSAEKALEQIRQKRYYEPYFSRKKPIILVGVAFDKEKRNISSFKAEQVKP
ncbi:MAG: ATP-binding protein [Candidatus Aminicenantes bacterium]|nr:ATP-binding protein [Candidatus Aminicenantes bacterium]